MVGRARIVGVARVVVSVLFNAMHVKRNKVVY